MAAKPGRFVPLSGNAVIDQHHAYLGDLLVACRDLARRGRFLEFRERTEEFREAIGRHFDQEERILRGAGYPGHREHGVRHATILSEIDRVVTDMAGATSAPPMFGALDALERALFDHELVDDSSYLDHIRRR